jgi:hypothetical protein
MAMQDPRIQNSALQIVKIVGTSIAYHQILKG